MGWISQWLDEQGLKHRPVLFWVQENADLMENQDQGWVPALPLTGHVITLVTSCYSLGPA